MTFPALPAPQVLEHQIVHPVGLDAEFSKLGLMSNSTDELVVSTIDTSSRVMYTDVVASNPKIRTGFVLSAIQVFENGIQVVLVRPVVLVKDIGFIALQL